MAPQDCEVLRMHARYVRLLCPELFPSASEAYAILQEARTILLDSGANISAPCTRDSRHACQLPRHLKQWNRILAPINLQLRERSTPGELEVICFDVFCDLPDSEFNVLRATLLVHWLLIKHSCVTALRVDDWGVFKHPAYCAFLCDGLHECRRLKSLKLCEEHPEVSEQHRLLAAMSDLRHLEEFACDALYVGDNSETMTALSSVVMRNAKLCRLAVERFIGKSSGMWNMAQALATNATITDLSLNLGCLRANERDLFAHELKRIRSLQSLRLVGSLLKPNLSVAVIAKATEGLTELVSLELSKFRFLASEVWELAMSLSRNKTVQHLALLSCRQFFAYLTSEPRLKDDSYNAIHWCMQPFVYMLREVTSLRKLVFTASSFPIEDQRAFFEVLAVNDFVEEVRIEKPSPSYLRDLFRVICETGTGSRVKIGDVDKMSQESSSGAACIRDVRVLVKATAHPGETYSCLEQLPAFHILTTLSINIENVIDAKSAEFFAHYLRNTQLLNSITMNLFACHDEAFVLLDALSYNTSITELVVERWCQCRHTARILAEVVCSMKKIRVLTYQLANKNPSPEFYSALAKRIEGNYTILSVKAIRLMAAAKEWNFIQEIVARNGTLLVHAARFVTGCAIEKSGAEALELLSADHMLVSKVQEMAEVDETEARNAIRSKLSELEDLDFFMSVAGVVKATVACQGAAEGRPCLGTMPYDCWRSLRQYLRVADVASTGNC